MSRSIHTTRRDVSLERRAEARARLEELLGRKRRIKASRRATVPTLDVAPPVVVVEEPFVHYPAGATDLENLIALLPARALEGVSAIELSLGRDAQDRGDPDPLTRRRGYERLPGVFSGATLGQYSYDDRRIRVFGFVSATPPAPRFELHLRLQMLSTFVHEVGHHLDNMRLARGRGRSESDEDGEIHAERHQELWTRRFVIPYLERAYPDQVAALLAWIEEHGGCPLRLEALTRVATTVRGGGLRLDAVFGGVGSALERVAAEVAAGKDRRATRLEFANELHYGERYVPALAITERVLAEHPDDVEAVTFKADLLEHMERYAEAEQLLRVVLARDPRSLEALRVLAFVLEDQERWAELLATAELCLELVPTGWMRASHREDRARALLGLGETARAVVEVEALERDGFARQTRRLQAFLEKGLLRE